MRFFFDHDASARVARALEELGHETMTVTDVMDRTTGDPEIFRYAADHGFIMVTCNRDDYLRIAPTLDHKGLIITIRRHSFEAERANFLRLLDRAGETSIAGNINFA